MTLRTAVLEFMDTVRRAEQAIAASRRDTDTPSELDVAAPLGVVTEDEWRRHWPSASSASHWTSGGAGVVSDDDMVDVDDLVDDLELDEPEVSRTASNPSSRSSRRPGGQAKIAVAGVGDVLVERVLAGQFRLHRDELGDRVAHERDEEQPRVEMPETV